MDINGTAPTATISLLDLHAEIVAAYTQALERAAELRGQLQLVERLIQEIQGPHTPPDAVVSEG